MVNDCGKVNKDDYAVNKKMLPTKDVSTQAYMKDIKQLNKDLDRAYEAWFNDKQCQYKKAQYEHCKANLDGAIVEIKNSTNRQSGQF